MNPVYIRVTVYMLSLLLGSVPAVALGWFSYQFVDGMIHISVSVEGAATAIFSAAGITGGVLKIWGKK